MVLKLSKIVSFLQFFADVSVAVIAIYVYASESSRFTLNGIACIGYYAMT